MEQQTPLNSFSPQFKHFQTSSEGININILQYLILCTFNSLPPFFSRNLSTNKKKEKTIFQETTYGQALSMLTCRSSLSSLSVPVSSFPISSLV